MRNDGQRLQGGVAGPGRANGFLPNSFRALSCYLRVVSSGASTVASTVRSAAAAASSVVDRDPDANRDQVLCAGFDKLEWESGLSRQVLLVGYQHGFQVWDVEEAANIRNLVYRNDGPVSLMQVLTKPVASKTNVDKFADFRPLLAVSRDGPLSEDVHALTNLCDARTQNFHNALGGGSVPVLWFYSLSSQSYVHKLKFKSAIYSVRCSTNVVAVALADQIHCFDAATLEREYTVFTNPVDTGCSGLGRLGYGPLAVGSRWLAYSGSAVVVSDSAKTSAPELTPATSSPVSKGSLVAQYAKESSKQLASGIVTLGDKGYKKFSDYCSEFLPESKNPLQSESPTWKVNEIVNSQLQDTDNVGMVVIRDVVSKSVIAQFRAHKSPISSLCFDPSGTLLVTASVKGHNINVFKILGSSCTSDPSASYVHLFRLQRGFTNAVIQDISFSDDSRWIMVSSSRGTSHLFAINPSAETVNFKSPDAYSAAVNSGLGVMTRSSVRWPPNAGSQVSELPLCDSGPPVTLSVVSRIRSGSNNWRSALSGAAAAATGSLNSMPGAIASAFHSCVGNNLKAKYHLLVFSPSGCLIQYAMRASHRHESAVVRSDFGCYDPALEGDARLIVEAVQKWNICQKHDRGERDDNVDIYGDSGNSDISRSCKPFPDGTRKKNGRCHEIRSTGRKTKVCPEEGYNVFISEAELRTHSACFPLWAKPKIHFQIMAKHEVKLGGKEEIEVEQIPCQMVEVRSKDLLPFFENPEAPRYQQVRTDAKDGTVDRVGGATRGAEDTEWEALVCPSDATKTFVNKDTTNSHTLVL